MVRNSRQSNTRVAAQFQGSVPGVIEMAALEDLGPRAVHAIKNMPLPILAAKIVSQFVEFNDQLEEKNKQRVAAGLPEVPYLDPKHPILDAKIAQAIVDETCGLLRLDQVAETDIRASLKPLTGTPSPRSIREQRKAMRGARRWR